MKNKIREVKTISGKVLMEKLRIKQDRTIEVYIRDGALPQPVKELKDGDMLFDKQKVLEMMGAKSFEVEFIGSEDAAKILNVTKECVNMYANKGLIPCYRLKNVRGSEILYLRSELESAKKYTIQWLSKFANRFGKERATKIIFAKLLSEELGFISGRHSDVFREIIVNDKPILEVVQMFKLTSSRVMQLFEQAITGIAFRLDSINKRMEKALQIDSEFEILKKKLKQYEDKEQERQAIVIPVELQKTLSINLEDVALPKRVFNILYAYEIRTIEDLVRISKNDFRKFRNAGKHSADELEAFLKSKGLTWSMKV